jgi:arginase
MMHATPAILHVRTNLGLVEGVEELGSVLLDHALALALGAEVSASIAAPPYTGERPDPGLPMHLDAIASVARQQADAVGDLLDAHRFPVVLGGDDSILFGNLLALRRRGRYGLAFVDGHFDFWSPADVPSGQASDSDLYMALGFGPAAIADLEARRPLLDAHDVVVVGQRDPDDEGETGQELRMTGATVVPLAEFRQRGVDDVVAAALARLESTDLDGFFVHLDADALDDAIMAAVDWRLPDGLTADEWLGLVRPLLASPRCVGVDVSIYNPRLDPDRSAARTLTDLLVAAWPTTSEP